MKKRVALLILVLLVLSAVVYAALPPPPAAPPKPNINFPDDLVGGAAGTGGNTGDPYDPFATGGSSSSAETGSVLGTSDDFGLGGTPPAAIADSPRVIPPAAQPRTPALEPDVESFSFWMMALIAGAGIIFILLIVLFITYFMKRKTIPESLKSYIRYNTQRGYRMDVLEPLLLNVGWSKEQIKKAHIEVLGRNQGI